LLTAPKEVVLIPVQYIVPLREDGLKIPQLPLPVAHGDEQATILLPKAIAVLSELIPLPDLQPRKRLNALLGEVRMRVYWGRGCIYLFRKNRCLRLFRGSAF